MGVTVDYSEYFKMKSPPTPCLGNLAREEQLIRIAMHFFPEEKWKFIPIFEGAMVSEVYKKMKNS